MYKKLQRLFVKDALNIVEFDEARVKAYFDLQVLRSPSDLISFLELDEKFISNIEQRLKEPLDANYLKRKVYESLKHPDFLKNLLIGCIDRKEITQSSIRNIFFVVEEREIKVRYNKREEIIDIINNFLSKNDHSLKIFEIYKKSLELSKF